jgi:predicted TIM-barrel fold metal-dependent hydrolase
MIIDFHAHAFPDALANRAISSLQYAAGGMEPMCDGTIQGLLHAMDHHGVDQSVVLNIATNSKQQQGILDFCILSASDRIVPFTSVHPFSEDAPLMLQKAADAGIKGLKLHPDYQQFDADDERAYAVYETIAQLGFTTVFHAGLDIGLSDPSRCTPAKLAKILPLFGHAPVVAAHMGGYMEWYEVEEHLVGRDVYFDISFCAGTMPMSIARRIVKTHGTQRILFGTDMPWHSPDQELRMVQSLDLTDEQIQQILNKNARHILGKGRNSNEAGDVQ